MTVLSIVVGATAALVQALGLVRWPFAVPELARRYVAAPDGPEGDATRQTVEVVFATLHRLLGVGIGEHLGYLFTGLWTLLVAASILSTAVLPSWLGIVGVPIGVALLIGTLEFVGPNERDGWHLPARSCRSPTSPGRSGSSRSGCSCSSEWRNMSVGHGDPSRGTGRPTARRASGPFSTATAKADDPDRSEDETRHRQKAKPTAGR